MGLTINQFLKIAQKAGDDERIVLQPGRGKNKVAIGDADHGLRGRVKLHDGEAVSQADENKAVRQELLDAALNRCGVDSFDRLPAVVKKAFNVTGRKDDMKLKGTVVCSGRPLTARRIKQIAAAIEASQQLTMEQMSENRAARFALYDSLVSAGHSPEFLEQVRDTLGLDGRPGPEQDKECVRPLRDSVVRQILEDAVMDQFKVCDKKLDANGKEIGLYSKVSGKPTLKRIGDPS